MKISDYQASCILEAMEHYMSAWGVKKDDKDCILREMKSFMNKMTSGHKNNVCFYCMGTGYKNGEELNEQEKAAKSTHK